MVLTRQSLHLSLSGNDDLPLNPFFLLPFDHRSSDCSLCENTFTNSLRLFTPILRRVGEVMILTLASLTTSVSIEHLIVLDKDYKRTTSSFSSPLELTVSEGDGRRASGNEASQESCKEGSDLYRRDD